MSQITTGIRGVLSSPRVYDLFQDLMGAQSVRRDFVRERIRPTAGARILDIGCGTARILDHMPAVDYNGFDMSQAYIDDAIRRYGGRGRFQCAPVQRATLDGIAPFDVVIAIGIVHHLDDDQAAGLMELAQAALRPGGRLVTIDPCFADGQAALSRFLVSKDRGRNVRRPEGYRSLAAASFNTVSGEVRHRAWIPYTHWIMECVR